MIFATLHMSITQLLSHLQYQEILLGVLEKQLNVPFVIRGCRHRAMVNIGLITRGDE